MIKLNKKLRSNSHKSAKVKVPKIEINECKMKTKDQKKLENEMFQQAKEARSLLDKLLIEDGTSYDEHGRLRANSLNSTVENLILSTHSTEYSKFMSARGSVPTIPTMYKRFFSKKRSPMSSNSSSPSSSPETTRRVAPQRHNENTKKSSRKHTERENRSHSSICQSPQTKRVCEPTKEETRNCEDNTTMHVEKSETCGEDL